MTFQIVKINPPHLEYCYEYGEYETAQEANNFCSILMQQFQGTKFQPRKVGDIKSPKEAYDASPDKDFFDKLSLGHHYPLRHPKETSLITYTDGRSVHTVHISNFLRNTYFHSDDLRRGAAFKFENISFKDEVQFTESYDDVKSVYAGITSCMSYYPDRYYSDDSPAYHAYSEGDLRVAYIRDNGRLVARTVVWPEKKIFGRIYGDQLKMTMGLIELGYHFGLVNEWIGAKIGTQYVPNGEMWDDDEETTLYESGWMMPYLDMYIKTAFITPCKKFMTLHPDGDHKGVEITGFSDEYYRTHTCTTPTCTNKVTHQSECYDCLVKIHGLCSASGIFLEHPSWTEPGRNKQDYCPLGYFNRDGIPINECTYSYGEYIYNGN